MRDHLPGYVPPADNIANWPTSLPTRVALQERITAERAARRNTSQGLSTADQPEQAAYVSGLLRKAHRANSDTGNAKPEACRHCRGRLDELSRWRNTKQPFASYCSEGCSEAANHAAPSVKPDTATTDGWIAHTPGQPCPVPLGVSFEARFVGRADRKYGPTVDGRCGEWCWTGKGRFGVAQTGLQITHYRIKRD